MINQIDRHSAAIVERALNVAWRLAEHLEAAAAKHRSDIHKDPH